MTPLDVAPVMALIAAVGLVVDSAEVLVERAALAPAGLYSWDVLGAGRRYLVRGPYARPLGLLFRYPAVLALPGIQLAAALPLFLALTLPMPEQRLVVAAAALTAGAARLLFYMRQQLGLDGGDQMISIVLLSCGFGAALGNTPAGYAAISYAALQLLLSYLISGVAKAVSAKWRSGAAIVGIVGTVGYGNPTLHRFLLAHPAVSKAMCWAVIAFECGAPLLVLGGPPGVVVLIVCGTAFHLGIAIVMGLNNFVWAFTAAYPALLMISTHLPHVVGVG